MLTTLWHHRVASGFFDMAREPSVLDSLFDFIPDLVCDIVAREKIGLDSSEMFCYIKNTHEPTWPEKKPISRKLRRDVLRHYGLKCYFCGMKLSGKGADTRIHHLTPEVIGGDMSIQNLRPLCHKCHYELHRGIGRTGILHYRDKLGVKEFVKGLTDEYDKRKRIGARRVLSIRADRKSQKGQ